MNKNENCLSDEFLKECDYEKEISFYKRNLKSATGTHSKNISINASPISKNN